MHFASPYPMAYPEQPPFAPGAPLPWAAVPIATASIAPASSQTIESIQSGKRTHPDSQTLESPIDDNSSSSNRSGSGSGSESQNVQSQAKRTKVDESPATVTSQQEYDPLAAGDSDSD